MSNDKEIINKLFKVVAQQQQIIKKIAQAVNELPPASLAPQNTTKREADIILNALAPNVRSSIKHLVVDSSRDPSVVKVQFVPNKGSVVVFNAIKATVISLQQKNALPGASYNIVEVPVK